MGFDPERFAAPVAAELQCKLCGRVLEEPLATPCGHVFCAGCLLPWAARRGRCPLRCRPLAPADLRPVLPLRSLVQKLEVKCDYSPRGCRRVLRLRELPAHLAACRYGPPAARPPGPEEGGPPGTPRPGEGHRSPRALRGGGPEPGPGPEPGREAVSWSRREKALLAQLWALQSEVRLTALRYQAKFGQYMSHISSITRDLTGGRRGGVSADPTLPAPLRQRGSPRAQFRPARSPEGDASGRVPGRALGVPCCPRGWSPQPRAGPASARGQRWEQPQSGAGQRRLSPGGNGRERRRRMGFGSLAASSQARLRASPAPAAGHDPLASGEPVAAQLASAGARSRLGTSAGAAEKSPKKMEDKILGNFGKDRERTAKCVSCGEKRIVGKSSVPGVFHHSGGTAQAKGGEEVFARHLRG